MILLITLKAILLSKHIKRFSINVCKSLQIKLLLKRGKNKSRNILNFYILTSSKRFAISILSSSLNRILLRHVIRLLARE
jgi:hypothetical protein